MLKVYRINGLKFRYEEGTQPEGAELVESVKTKVVTPEVKIILPEDVATKKTTRKTKKG